MGDSDDGMPLWLAARKILLCFPQPWLSASALPGVLEGWTGPLAAWQLSCTTSPRQKQRTWSSETLQLEYQGKEPRRETAPVWSSMPLGQAADRFPAVTCLHYQTETSNCRQRVPGNVGGWAEQQVWN
ncbi:hypothetical protein GN956_G8896 [Arapaima gigas]